MSVFHSSRPLYCVVANGEDAAMLSVHETEKKKKETEIIKLTVLYNITGFVSSTQNSSGQVKNTT